MWALVPAVACMTWIAGTKMALDIYDAVHTPQRQQGGFSISRLIRPCLITAVLALKTYATLVLIIWPPVIVRAQSFAFQHQKSWLFAVLLLCWLLPWLAFLVGSWLNAALAACMRQNQSCEPSVQGHAHVITWVIGNRQQCWRIRVFLLAQALPLLAGLLLYFLAFIVQVTVFVLSIAAIDEAWSERARVLHYTVVYAAICPLVLLVISAVAMPFLVMPNAFVFRACCPIVPAEAHDEDPTAGENGND